MRTLINFIRRWFLADKQTKHLLHYTSNENYGNGPYRSPADIVVASEAPEHSSILVAMPVDNTAMLKSVFQKIGGRVADDQTDYIRKGLDEPRLRHFFEKTVLCIMKLDDDKQARIGIVDLDIPKELLKPFFMVFQNACKQLDIQVTWNTEYSWICADIQQVKKFKAFIPTQSFDIEAMTQQMLGKS
jgi:hypothetical protein